MKRLILLVTVLVSGFSFAQEGFKQGDVMISGSVGFTNSKNPNINVSKVFGTTGNFADTGNAKGNTFNFQPKVAYFVTDNIAAGLQIGFDTMKDTYENVNRPTYIDEVRQNEFNVGLFGRYYFTPANKFSLFGQLGFNYLSGKDKVDYFNNTSVEFKYDGFNVGLGVGVNYFINKNFALEATWGAFQYESTRYHENVQSSENEFKLKADLSALALGLNYKF